MAEFSVHFVVWLPTPRWGVCAYYVRVCIIVWVAHIGVLWSLGRLDGDLDMKSMIIQISFIYLKTYLL